VPLLNALPISESGRLADAHEIASPTPTEQSLSATLREWRRWRKAPVVHT